MSKPEQVHAEAAQTTPAVFRPELFLTGLNTPICVQILLEKQEMTIGTAVDNDVALTFDNEISHHHCRFAREEEMYTVMDTGSSNGTFLNGQKLDANERYQIRPGDHIQLAGSVFEIEALHRKHST